MSHTLKDQLRDWTDFDVTGLYVGKCLGIFSPDITHVTEIKHVFWSAHPVGEAIGRFLDQLVHVGVLEHDDERLLYRWNPTFRGTWEA